MGRERYPGNIPREGVCEDRTKQRYNRGVSSRLLTLLFKGSHSFHIIILIQQTSFDVGRHDDQHKSIKFVQREHKNKPDIWQCHNGKGDSRRTDSDVKIRHSDNGERSSRDEIPKIHHEEGHSFVSSSFFWNSPTPYR